MASKTGPVSIREVHKGSIGGLHFGGLSVQLDDYKDDDTLVLLKYVFNVGHGR